MPKVRRSTRNSSRKIVIAIRTGKRNPQRQPKQSAKKIKKITKVVSKQRLSKNKRISKKKNSFSKQLKKENYNAFKKLPVPLKKISHFSQNKRLQLQQAHPKLAPYLFLSVAQKKKFFLKKNREYKIKMKSESVKKQKQVKFLSQNKVLYFNKHEPSAKIDNSQAIVQKTKRKNAKNQNYYYEQIK